MSKAVYSYWAQACCYHGDIIYFAYNQPTIIQSYNMTHNIIANITTTPMINQIYFCITITDDGDTLFINGGYDGVSYLNTTLILNMSTSIWDSITIPNMNKSMFIFNWINNKVNIIKYNEQNNILKQNEGMKSNSHSYHI